jgi:hypothetical protein
MKTKIWVLATARVIQHGLAPGSMGWAGVNVGAENRTTADKLCAKLEV